MSDDMRVVGVASANGNPTGDKRTIAAPALRWSLPLPLRRAREDFGGHNGAVTVGAITNIKQAPTGELMYAAVLFDTEDGRAAYAEMSTRYATSGLKYGISVDLDDVVVTDDPDDPEMSIVTSGRLRGATLCDIPAYSTAYAVLASQIPESLAASAMSLFEVMDSLYDAAREAGIVYPVGIHESVNGDTIRYDMDPFLVAPVSSLVAAGAPRSDLPRTWFGDPGLTGPTPLTITPEGRIFGHAALHQSCHIGYPGVCKTPPRSLTNYAYFNTGAIQTVEGDLVPVGHLTSGIGHADPRLAAASAAEHYDNVNSVVADITCGEDAHGIWFAGAVREGITEAQKREIQANNVSGDWRTINNNLEMVALLSVPVPGFPVPRMRAMVASGTVTSLVASACFDSEAIVEDETVVEVAEPSVDVAEVAPESVAAAMAEEAPAVEEEPVTLPEVEESPEAEEPEDGEVIPVVDVTAASINELRAEIAALREALMPTPVEADPDVEPVEAVAAIENKQEDLLAALDALVQGDKPNIGSLLAELDAKVG